MARRSTPARLEQARRSATIARLISSGMLPDRAADALRRWEAAQDGPLALDDYDRAYRELTARGSG